MKPSPIDISVEFDELITKESGILSLNYTERLASIISRPIGLCCQQIKAQGCT